MPAISFPVVVDFESFGGACREKETRRNKTDLLLAARRRSDLHAFHIRQKPPRGPHAGAIENFEQTRQGESKMNKTEFTKLVASVKQAGKIRRGEMKAARVFNLKPVDVKAIRSKLGLSQGDFAAMIGVSVSTLQNWEQGRRRPEGPAQALLKVAASNPQAVVDALAR